MQRIHPTAGAVTLLACMSALSGTAGRAQAPQVTVEKIKYTDLGKLIRSLKGKVILVDFWGEF